MNIAIAPDDLTTAEPFPSLQSNTFPPPSRELFARSYPEEPHLLDHTLRSHDLLELDALAALAERLPPASVEYNRGDLPIGVTCKPGSNGRSIGDTIRHIARSESWAVLKNVERDPAFDRLLRALLAELRPAIEARTGTMLHLQAFVFISSPGAVTPYHFDPEHNILLQVRGSKVMTQFPAGHTRYVPDTVHETYHAGGARELQWRDDMKRGGREFAMGPGQAVYVPVMAPHFVRNGPDSSVSLSITWRSKWSYAEAEARAMNRLLRRAGMNPAAPGRWPMSNRTKSLAYRALRKLRLTR